MSWGRPWAAYQAMAATAYFNMQPEWKVKKQSPIIWGELKKELAKRVHALGRHCHLLVLTSHTRQMFDDAGQPVKRSKEVVFYDRVWQALDLVGFLTRVTGSPIPKVTFRPPFGKSRIPAMPEKLEQFSWAEVFKYSVKQLDLPTPEERRADPIA